MNTERIQAITRKGLVKILHEYGYTNVKERTVESWQGKELLPPFDTKGSGRGKGQGRAAGSWSNCEGVVRQAICVHNLLRKYRNAEKVFIPLIMLGYKVPISRLRSSLTNPVVEGLDEVMKQSQGFENNIEDALMDSAGALSEQMCRAKVPLFSAPVETLDAIGNIFFNENYDFDDSPFEDGKEALRAWERKISETYSAFGEGSGSEGSFPLFDQAEFINKYFSLPSLRRALDECTNDDLERVGRDLEIIGEVGFHLTEFVLRNMPPDFEMTKEFAYATIFKAGTYAALVDLSLRRNGYAAALDSAAEQALQSFREEALPLLSAESSTAPLFATAMVEVCNLLKELGTQIPSVSAGREDR